MSMMTYFETNLKLIYCVQLTMKVRYRRRIQTLPGNMRT